MSAEVYSQPVSSRSGAEDTKPAHLKLVPVELDVADMDIVSEQTELLQTAAKLNKLSYDEHFEHARSLHITDTMAALAINACLTVKQTFNPAGLPIAEARLQAAYLATDKAVDTVFGFFNSKEKVNNDGIKP